VWSSRRTVAKRRRCPPNIAQQSPPSLRFSRLETSLQSRERLDNHFQQIEDNGTNGYNSIAGIDNDRFTEGFRTPAVCIARHVGWSGRPRLDVGQAFESPARKKPRGRLGAVWLGATYGDLKVGGETIEGIQPQLLKVQTRD
jgi:hypothetical protein